jgi:hypothetical protein
MYPVEFGAAYICVGAERFDRWLVGLDGLFEQPT